MSNFDFFPNFSNLKAEPTLLTLCYFHKLNIRWAKLPLPQPQPQHFYLLQNTTTAIEKEPALTLKQSLTIADTLRLRMLNAHPPGSNWA